MGRQDMNRRGGGLFVRLETGLAFRHTGKSSVHKREVSLMKSVLMKGLAGLAGVMALSGLARAQVPVDAASDRRAGEYAYFQSFGVPKTPMLDLDDVSAVRADSDRYFLSALATCSIGKAGCDAEVVYELADRFCQSMEFDEAVTWRLSRQGERLVLHWTVCGLKE